MSLFPTSIPAEVQAELAALRAEVKTLRASPKSAPAARRQRAVQSFKTAAECIGPVSAGLSVFAVTRGQFSMLDAVLHVLDEVGPAAITLWTWTIADYEIQRFTELALDGRITGGTLVIDHGARNKNADLIAAWKQRFGRESVRYVLNHSKIATVETAGGLRVLLRGSMNLNFNPRFEQLDVTEGGPDFDLVREIEAELPVLPDNAPGAAVYAASKVADAFDAKTLAIFSGVRTWAK